MTLFRRLLLAALLAPCAAFAQQPAVVTTTAERSAVIETIDAQTRTLLLRGEDGTLSSFGVGAQVRNFGELRPGDRVVLTVTDAVAVSMARPGEQAARADAEIATRNRAGQRPGGSLTEAKRVRMRIEAVDAERSAVAFTDPEGRPGEVILRDARMRRFAATLRPGDLVDVVFLESISLRVLRPG